MRGKWVRFLVDEHRGQRFFFVFGFVGAVRCFVFVGRGRGLVSYQGLAFFDEGLWIDRELLVRFGLVKDRFLSGGFNGLLRVVGVEFLQVRYWKFANGGFEGGDCRFLIGM